MSSNTPFTSENLDFYLKALAKEYRKQAGKTAPAEVVLIGGAAILANYGFREMTYDMDAIISASSAMEDAILRVTDQYNLPNGWINTDFKRTKSYTPKLIEHSAYYKTFSGVLTVRTVTAEYLIAMKLVSGRIYKNDLSDVVGIVGEHRRRGKPITFDAVERAVIELYGSWDMAQEHAKEFARAVLESPDAETLYERYRSSEIEAKDILLDVERQYPGAVNEESAAEILKKAREKKRRQSESER